ncbi:MAG: hypothetical protein EXS48_02165 [Candidatus Staskawiczbacteria bacterium]|nr:hypothetical protein [Candidatus Staskawiczbacteria bacterium]
MEGIVVTGVGFALVGLLAVLLTVATKRGAPVVEWYNLTVGERYSVKSTEDILSRKFAHVVDSKGLAFTITLPDFYREIVAGDVLVLCVRYDGTLRLKVCDDIRSLV